MNRKGRIRIDGIKEVGWHILNGNIKKDEEWTFTGGIGESLIDYILRDEETEEEVEKMVIILNRIIIL